MLSKILKFLALGTALSLTIPALAAADQTLKINDSQVQWLGKRSQENIRVQSIKIRKPC